MTLFGELKRRKVVRTTSAYLAAAFVVAQGVQVLGEGLGLPSWVLRAVLILAIAGIPFVIALAWALDVSREGVTVTDDETPGRSPLPWRRLLIPLAASIALLVPAAWLVVRGATAPTIGTLVVLPFQNTSGNADEDYFSDGMRDELAVALTQIDGLRITGRTSSYLYKDTALAAEDIGRALRVDAILGGTVRRAGGRLRVTSQLVGTRDGKVMWDSVFESRSSDVFGVQDEFTRAIVAALMPRLSRRSRSAPAVATRRGTTNTDAYDLYQKGRYLWLERGYDNVLASIPYYERAIRLDPQFARAHAGLAATYATLPAYVEPRSEWLAAQEASARRAVALDPNLAEAHLALGLVLEVNYMDLAGAEREYRAALALEPGDASIMHVYGFMLVAQGRTEEGLAQLLRATRIDPLAKSAGSAYSLMLSASRRFPDAMAEARRVLALDPTFVLGLYTLGYAQAFGGMPDSAVHTFERSLRLNPESRLRRGMLVFAYEQAGRRADAEQLRAALHAGNEPSSRVDAAFADLVLGDREPLLSLLESADGRRAWYRTHSVFGCNPMLDPLRDEPRFRSAMRDMGIPLCDLPPVWHVP